MNCADFEERDIRARYVAGRLSAEEEQAFEGHLVDCPKCQDAVELETGLRDGLKAAAPARTLPAPASASPAVSWKASPLTQFLQIAAALLLAVSIGLGAWLARTSSELRSARADRDQSQLRAGQAEQSSAALQQRLAGLERSANDAQRALLPAAVFALTTVRGSSTSESGPVNRVTLDRNVRLVVFSLDLPGGPGDYSVVLKDQAGRSLWNGDTPPSSPDALSVAIESKLLAAGDYLLELQQRPASGNVTLVGRYPFRVIAR